jgi:hypothetical protein
MNVMMKGYRRYWRNVVVVVGVVLGLTVLATIPVVQADQKPKVFPLDSSPYGNTYGEWGARWWQWLLSIPDATNPNFDTTGANCAVGQVGPVWFLAGTFDISYTRSCTVPAGKALLFTPLTQINGSGAFDCDPTAPGLCNLNALRALAAAFADNPNTLEATVDGHALQNLSDFRVQSPVFSTTYPEGAVFGLPSGTFTPNVSDGYWIMLAPLSEGKHTIHFKALSNGGFGADVTYNLTVK